VTADNVFLRLTHLASGRSTTASRTPAKSHVEESKEFSIYEALANQVEHLKALLDACLADIKARFATSNGAPV